MDALPSRDGLTCWRHWHHVMGTPHLLRLCGISLALQVCAAPADITAPALLTVLSVCPAPPAYERHQCSPRQRHGHQCPLQGLGWTLPTRACLKAPQDCPDCFPRQSPGRLAAVVAAAAAGWVLARTPRLAGACPAPATSRRLRDGAQLHRPPCKRVVAPSLPQREPLADS